MKPAILQRLAALEDSKQSPSKFKITICSSKKDRKRAIKSSKNSDLGFIITVRIHDNSTSAIGITEPLREHNDIELKTNTIHKRKTYETED